MSRIASATAHEHLLNVVLRTQQRMLDAQRQVASEQKSPDYAGIGAETARLIDLEATKGLLDRFDKTGAVIEARLETAAVSLDAIDETIRDFRQMVLDAGGNRPLDEEHVRDIQTWAFHALNEMEAYLNTRADGGYLFSGSAVRTEPVRFDFETLADFQAAFDGRTTTVAGTRAAHLQAFALEPAGDWLIFEESATGPSRIRSTTPAFAGLAEGATITLTGTGANDGRYTVTRVVDDQTIEVATEKLVDEPPNPADPPVAAALATADGTRLDPTTTGGLRFDGVAGTLTAQIAGSLSALPPGTVFRIEGSAGNDGTFQVTANDGTTLSVRTRTLTDTGGLAVAGALRAEGYYRGDGVARTNQIDPDRAVRFDVTAADPAVEKAMRAMAMLAQGAYGTAGGLEIHPERIEDALALLASALDGGTAGGGGAAGEDPGTLGEIRGRVGFERMLIQEAAERRRELSAALEGRIGGIEKIEPAEAIARFLDESQALEASFQAIARIKGLSLTRFL